MSVFTELSKMWLTRSTKPFIFENRFEERLYFINCKNLGLYIHIPFCESICSFCPYCKVKYNKELCDDYIDTLIDEIHLVGSSNCLVDNKSNLIHKKQVTSLYFGGGTPALVSDKIKEILDTVNKYFIITDGIGIELHPENVTVETLNTLKEAGITKISIGIQSFNNKYQSILGRKKVDTDKLSNALSQVRFETVSMDFIFALPNQTFEDLKRDIDTAISIGANHIAIYPFIDFSFTENKVNTMSKNQKRKLLDSITEYFDRNNFYRNSIWTFSKDKGVKYSSMTRDNFLGFGCSATTLLKDTFKVNTFSIEEYQNRVKSRNLPTSLTVYFTLRQRMIYYLFWTAYTTKVSESDFKDFFGISLNKMYGLELKLAQLLGFITKKDGIYRMTNKGAFYYHHYENFYTLAYIDKMWGIMKDKAFPERIEL